ncbi:DUF6527 family protein [Hyphococcus luteus]|uniref:Uncharacterized protein n=1 Tax=Hyphococcus luteus TaxID=2058213 RepID=A0A2S7K048_9PROT|nr:hypothetical protein CW354_20330 [Marinicaulis flavus]
MKSLFINIVRRLGFLKADFIAETRPRLPRQDGSVSPDFVLAKDGGIKKWASLRCPGGCGRRIDLSLNPHQRPRWSVTLDWWRRPTVSPSVHQRNACGCHFWIKRGQVNWCKNGRPQMHLNAAKK